MLDNKNYTGNRTDVPDFLKVLLTLKKNIMKDLNVAEVGQVTEIQGDEYTVVSLNNNSLRLKCIKLKELSIKVKDIVVVLFTNTNFRLNLKKIQNNQTVQNNEDETLHSTNYGIIIGSL